MKNYIIFGIVLSFVMCSCSNRNRNASGDNTAVGTSYFPDLVEVIDEKYLDKDTRAIREVFDILSDYIVLEKNQYIITVKESDAYELFGVTGYEYGKILDILEENNRFLREYLEERGYDIDSIEVVDVRDGVLDLSELSE